MKNQTVVDVNVKSFFKKEGKWEHVSLQMW